MLAKSGLLDELGLAWPGALGDEAQDACLNSAQPFLGSERLLNVCWHSLKIFVARLDVKGRNRFWWGGHIDDKDGGAGTVIAVTTVTVDYDGFSPP